ncbi:hypothetical protein [Larkinella punicea]|uniref:Uncharacterized protein n=1 Tax=Larkinella punicea TaxID=2315727 RepID=A0A368JKH9_9BACT|nr:hypothetical protein [Larkinella punicea]RCR68177.1 hypothetical protein DUE52_17380 [Larkinella punicea]
MSNINPGAGRFISKDEADQFKGAYQERKKQQQIPQEDTVRSEFFGSDNLHQILDQPGCIGIRVYHAKRRESVNGNEHLVPRVVLVGIDKNGREILELTDPVEAGMKDMPSGREGQLADGPICPPECNP